MRFEQFESRHVLTQLLGPAVPLNIDALADTNASPPLPEAIQFRDTAGDFTYASSAMSPEAIDAFVASTEAWSSNVAAEGFHYLDDPDLSFRKGPNYQAPSIAPEGYIVAERFATDTNAHTMMNTRTAGTDCHHTSGMYTHQDHHYMFSFDVRHPVSEASWLSQSHWGIVMQLWGPREPGETPRNPPFAIYSRAVNGQPYWRISSFGDSRAITQTGDYEEHYGVEVPMGTIGEWHRFDVEYVPNPFGGGLTRTWLNGEIIAQWQGIKNNYHSMIEGHLSGPLNPGFGLYSNLPEDGMEVHIDNISLKCHGAFQTSIAGAVSGAADREGHLVYATNQQTGEIFGDYTERFGVYALNVPPGTYTVTTVHRDTGGRTEVRNVSTLEASSLVNIAITDDPVAVADGVTLTADVTGDGKTDIVNRVADGSWQVSVANGDGTYSTSRWSGWSTNVEWRNITTGDFNGDGKQDIVGQVTDGNWWVAISTGTGFQSTFWGRWSTQVEWLDTVVGDFNGDGMSDLAGREASGGNWWVSQSLGNGFGTSHWGRWSSSVVWTDTSVGDFNGDGLDDIAARVASDGNWWVAISRGDEFMNDHFGAWSTVVTWSDINVGDFNGDGLSDIVGRTNDGNWWVAESTGTRFFNRHWGSWTTAVNWTNITVADVNGDDTPDLIGQVASDGSWWVAQSTGREFFNYFWGVIWDHDEDWLVVSGDDFDGDGKADLLGATANEWRLATS